MVRKCIIIPTRIKRNATEKGESIEETLRRLSANKQPIPENVPPIYTPKKEGVMPSYDPRADRMEIAREAQDKFNASEIARGENIGDFGEDISEKTEHVEQMEGE